MYKSVYHVLQVLKVCESVLLCMLPRLGMRQNSLIVNLTNNLSHVISLEFESMYQPDVNKLFRYTFVLW